MQSHRMDCRLHPLIIMKILSPRKIIGLALTVLVIGSASAQIHLQIDWSDSSAVTFTGTGTVATNAYVGSPSGLTYEDGITVKDFFTSDVDNDSTIGILAPTSTTLYADSETARFFTNLVTWDYVSQDGVSVTNDLNFYIDGDSTPLDFDTGTAAFSGVATWDLSNDSSFIDFWPTMGTTGTLHAEASAIVIGTWEVVGAGSAVPEPSSYTALMGAFALAGAIGRRRGRRANSV